MADACGAANPCPAQAVTPSGLAETVTSLLIGSSRDSGLVRWPGLEACVDEVIAASGSAGVWKGGHLWERGRLILGDH